MKGKWLYDISLNEYFIGDSGDLEFETKEEAKKDADDYCISLAKEYDVKPKDFDIQIYQAMY
jgi:hypothetical protein